MKQAIVPGEDAENTFKSWEESLRMRFVEHTSSRRVYGLQVLDSIDRNIMFKILRHFWVPEPIHLFNEGTRSAVIIDSTATEESEVKTAVLQEDILAAYLFIAVINWVVRNADIDNIGFITRNWQSSRIPVKKIEEMEYANNIVLLENNTGNAE